MNVFMHKKHEQARKIKPKSPKALDLNPQKQIKLDASELIFL